MPAIVQAATANGTTHGGREAEDEQQRDQRHSDRDQLAAAQVRREDPIEVALDGRLARDERRPARPEHAALPAARPCASSPRAGSSDVWMSAKTRASVSQLSGRPVGTARAARRAARLRRARLGRRRRRAPREDDREHPVVGLVEAFPEDRPGALGVRAGHCERVGEERRESCRRPAHRGRGRRATRR